jgi:hypothetical protein
MTRCLPLVLAMVLVAVSCRSHDGGRQALDPEGTENGAGQAGSTWVGRGVAAGAANDGGATGGVFGGAAGGEAPGDSVTAGATSSALDGAGGSFEAAGINDPAAIEHYITAFCGVLGSCCELASIPTDPARCRRLFASLGLDYDPAAGEACLREQRAAATEGTLCDHPFSSDTCDRAWLQRGSKQLGESCTTDADCAPSKQGKVACQAWSGTGNCQLQLRGDAGATPCVATVYSGYSTLREPPVGPSPTTAYLCYAADGLQCNTNHVCTPFGIVGDRCQWSSECDETSYCEPNLNPPQCAPRAPLGARCDRECARGAWCNQLTQICESQRPADAACEADEQCLSSICLNQRCMRAGWAYFCGGT